MADKVARIGIYYLWAVAVKALVGDLLYFLFVFRLAFRLFFVRLAPPFTGNRRPRRIALTIGM